MSKDVSTLTIIGGGLAGSEAAWQAGQRGVDVILYEMRPEKFTGAHTSPYLAELVCSNSLGSNLLNRASGLLKEELRRLGSIVINCAEDTAVPAGGALAVDRNAFAKTVTERIEAHPRIRVIRKEVIDIPGGPTIIASGPLTSESLSHAIRSVTGREHLYFFDAMAPIVSHESINTDIAFWGSRYERGEKEKGDYINCPFDRESYDIFISALRKAGRIKLKKIDQQVDGGVNAGSLQYFEGCLPVEVLAKRGREALAYGPMRPVGLIDPKSGDRPYAVVQLRQDNLAGSLYNMVGFQTNLKYDEQDRVFRLIPGLEKANFVRYGQMHRNTYIFSPALLQPTLQTRNRDDLFFAGQITGIEGYTGNIASGLLAGCNAARLLKGRNPMIMPETTLIGALCYYISNASPEDFQPMKANFGILPTLEGPKVRDKRERFSTYSRRSLEALENLISEID
ncbi:methylenetetrahydrofolate--tRNA-(uracil(54)-C(5))-methyltransferase (FADH(2)-oxidizing) TrmFO [Chloroflexota bacterium]